MTQAAVVGGSEFAVRRIYCVGQNYRAHTLEMGGNPDREFPFFFAKPADAILPDGATMPYPPMTERLEHEVELVVAIGADGVEVATEDAPALIFGYAVGLDMTRRDLQAVAKKAGRPWDMAKGFDHSAPLGAILPAKQAGVLTGTIRLEVNGTKRQESRLTDMIWSVPEIVAELSRYIGLRRGDLIFTGTPEGVGPVAPGDRLMAHIDGLPELHIRIAGA